MATEDFLNRLGVNTHLNGLTTGDPWNTNAAEVGSQLRYIGVRLVRDWAWSAADGVKWKAVQSAWNPLGRFWTSIDEGSPKTQRASLSTEIAIYSAYPNLIYAMGGPNEEDDDYARSQGASLPDAAEVQKSLYGWSHSDGRRVPVSQMEFGAGWTALNHWQGDYNPVDTGIGQNYSPGPADFAGAHTYLSNDKQLPAGVIDQLRSLAVLSTPGKPVAHTEIGAYQAAKLTPELFGQFLVAGAFDALSHGDAAYIVYGLQDSAPEQTFGFFTYPGGKAHPAADYFHTLTQILRSDRLRYGPGQSPTYTPKPLVATFSNAAVSHLTLQKPTGEFVVALWTEKRPSVDDAALTETIRLGSTFDRVQIYDVEQGVPATRVSHSVSDIRVTMTPSHLYLVVFGSPHAGNRPAPSK
jgi:hypothetical protein